MPLESPHKPETIVLPVSQISLSGGNLRGPSRDRARDRQRGQKKTEQVLVHPSPSAPRTPQPVPDTNVTVGFQSHDIGTCEGTERLVGAGAQSGNMSRNRPLCACPKSHRSTNGSKGSKVDCENQLMATVGGMRTGTKRSSQPDAQPVPAWRVP